MKKNRKKSVKPEKQAISAPETGLNKKDMLLLGVLVLVAFLIRIYFLQFYKVISADGTGYANAARAFLKDGSISIGYGAVYPVLVGFMELAVNDVELSGQLVSMIMGSLLVVPVYLLGSVFFNRRVGLMSCMFCLVWPSLRSWSGAVMTQATYITLTLTGVYFTWISFKNNSRALQIVAGVIMSLAYMTRPEAFAIFVAMIIALCCFRLILVKKLEKDVLFFLIFSMAGFLVASFPYLNHIHNLTGEWQLAGKTGTTLNSTLSHYLNKPDLIHDPNQETLGYVGLMKKYPDLVPWNIKRNLKDTWNLVPVYLWVLCLVGFLWGKWNKEGVVERFFLLTTFSPYVVIITFYFVGPEYIQPYLPVMFLWVCHAMDSIEKQIWDHIDSHKMGKYGAMARLSPIAMITVFFISSSVLYSQIPADPDKPYHYNDDGARYDHKRMGLLLKKYLPQDSKIMTRWGRISFYAGMERVDLIQGSASNIYKFAIDNKADFIIIDGLIIRARPQLGLLFKPLLIGTESMMFVSTDKSDDYKPYPWLKLHLLYKDPSSIGVAVYKILYDQIDK